MTEPLLAADVSYYQKYVDDTYPHKWLIFRCCDGDFLDPKGAGNAKWCRAAVASGRLLGWTTYVVYRPGKNSFILKYLAKLAAPIVEIDIESWKGAIKGDHSSEINALGDAIEQQGSQVWVYGNAGDLKSIAPNRRAWPVVLAAYRAKKPSIPNMIGWQYSDGKDKWEVPAGFPRASPPFGRCDHDQLFLTADLLSGRATALGDWMSEPLSAANAAAINNIVVNVMRSEEVRERIASYVWQAALNPAGAPASAEAVVTGASSRLAAIGGELAHSDQAVAQLAQAIAALPPGQATDANAVAGVIRQFFPHG